LSAQDTFSIVAVDTATGEVGSAGATCLDENLEGVSAVIISDLVPGRGAIHTQSFWNAANQLGARQRMESGDSPSEIITWLLSNDEGGNPAIRQYGIADISPNGSPRSAAFTGQDCFDAKGHRTGLDYAIQGNILLNEAVLDSMEARFLATAGEPLPIRLMAAMQGANVAGADSRCLDEGVSSRSAFLRVAKPGDPSDAPTLDLRVDATPFGVEPIDELQDEFDQWLTTSVDHPHGNEELQVQIFPNPPGETFSLRTNRVLRAQVVLWTAGGKEAGRFVFEGKQAVLPSPESPGLYWVILQHSDGSVLESKKLVVGP